MSRTHSAHRYEKAVAATHEVAATPFWQSPTGRHDLGDSAASSTTDSRHNGAQLPPPSCPGTNNGCALDLILLPFWQLPSGHDLHGFGTHDPVPTYGGTRRVSRSAQASSREALPAGLRAEDLCRWERTWPGASGSNLRALTADGDGTRRPEEMRRAASTQRSGLVVARRMTGRRRGRWQAGEEDRPDLGRSAVPQTRARMPGLYVVFVGVTIGRCRRR